MDEQWGKYRLRRLIARGGMAEVFHAEMLGPSGFLKPVCLKRVRPEFSDNAEFVQMFESEARIAATLQHPNIVQVFDFDRHEGQLFLAMEFVDGLDLRHVLSRAHHLGLRLSLEFAVCVMEGLLAGLYHAHSRRAEGEPRPVVHRDVSPHNILISTDGVVKLADFGIAKARGLSDVTQSGVIKGKLAYLSPEQARGEEVTTQSDYFSAGLVLFEMLTGQRFFRADDDTQLIAQVLMANFSPVPGISETLNQLLSRLLAREPADRFESGQNALDAMAKAGVAGCGSLAAGRVVEALQHVGEQAEYASSSGSPALQTIGTPSGKIEESPTSTEEEEEGKERESKPPAAPTRIQTPIQHVEIQPKKRSRAPLAFTAVAATIALFVFAFLWANRDATVPDEMETLLSSQPIEENSSVQQKVTPAAPESSETEGVKAANPPPPPLPAVQLIGEIIPDAGSQVEGPDVSFAESPAEQKSQTGHGMLEINVRPWARVKVDGVDKGTTPLKKQRLKAGPHRVTLVNKQQGYRRSFTVQIRPGKMTVVNRNIKSKGAN